MSTVLLAYAAPVEGERVVVRHPDALLLGTGKTAAAFALACELSKRRVDLVLLFGVCGAHPGRLDVGDLCVVGEDSFVDEGVLTPNGFLDLTALDLGDPGPFAADAELSERVCRRLPARRVRGSTVSTCSGPDALAAARFRRGGAEVETMEGAAVGLVCRELNIPWLQIRCVSNHTGNRDTAPWDLHGAVDRVQDAVLSLMAEGIL